MKITIHVENDHGTFNESFPDVYAAQEYLFRSPFLTTGSVRARETPGTVYLGPASIPPAPPGPETVDFVLQRGRDPEQPAGQMLVADGSDDTRKQLFDRAARLAGGVLDPNRAVPAVRIYTGPGHRTSVVHDSGCQVIFTMPAVLRS